MLHHAALLFALVAAPTNVNSVKSPSVGPKAPVEQTVPQVGQAVQQKVHKANPEGFGQLLNRGVRPTSLMDLIGDEDPQSMLFGGSTVGGSMAAGYGGTMVNKGTMSQGGVQLTYFTVNIDTGSGYMENFIVYAPTPMPAVPRPMVVAFHGFGNTQKDIVYNTKFLEHCAARGWFMLAPLSASKGHFMSDPGQHNTQTAIDWAMASLNVDPTRVYGVGFSMGGGMALNYAARHMDQTRGMFAAVVSHTGAVDLNDVYESDPFAQYVFDFWYGDESPQSADPELMVNSSLIQWIPYYQQVNPNTDLARNLMHLPMKLVRADNDPLAYLGVQSDRLHQHMQSLGRQPGPNYAYEVLPGNEHTWDLLDIVETLDWLSQFSLALPTDGRTIAVSEATYFHFFVDQEVPGELTPFTWSVDDIVNELRVTETENLNLLAVNIASTGLSTLQPLNVVLEAADGNADKIVLTGYDVPPINVVRDGVAVPAPYWTYNSFSKSVTLTETDGQAVHTWTIIP